MFRGVTHVGHSNLKTYQTDLVCEISRSFERSSLSDFRTQGSFIHVNSGKIFERDLVSSDSVAKSAMQKPWVFSDWIIESGVEKRSHSGLTRFNDIDSSTKGSLESLS